MIRLEGERIEDVLGYDNSHPHPGHADGHHKHTWTNDVETITHIGVEGWPTLGDVIVEVEEWWGQSHPQPIA